MVGNTFPVFTLTDSTGDVITRWVGYSASGRFIGTLKAALRDLTTVEERVVRDQTAPGLQDILFLAKYYSDVRDYLKAVDYYQRAVDLGEGTVSDFSYKVFENTASAAWDGLIPFDDVEPSAQAVLNSETRNINEIVKVVRILGRLARKEGRTELIPVYLEAGLAATANSSDPDHSRVHGIFAADRILYVDRDTAAAIRAIETSQGQGWKEDPKRLYAFGQWCFERGVDFEQARRCLTSAARLAPAGRFKAVVLHSLAEILDALGRAKEAARIMEMAVDESPQNRYYVRELKRFQEKLDKKPSDQ